MQSSSPQYLSPVFLTAPHYVLGEIEEDHTSIANLRERIAEFGMPKTDRRAAAEVAGRGPAPDPNH